ncbi:MAG: SDR family NAD(P)-dependent oxidoreductase [Deltaproteobacteria bacterium]|nr:MAG: SDR family NAD(P)-dependent oxidoreductase [Deltaproteobacteria bacterium]
MNIALLGATRGIGRALARLAAARGDRLVLLGRDRGTLERSAADLAARTGRPEPPVVECDLDRPEDFGAAVDAAFDALGGRIDAFVVTAARFATQEALEDDLEETAVLLRVDFTHTIVLCEHVRRRFEAQGGGTIAVFSSVAGDAPRKPVAIYGAAKAGLSHYVLSMDLRHRDRGIRYVCIKPGFVRTQMTAGLPEPPFAADPDVVAARALRAIDKAAPEAYVPAIWRLVMLVIRHLPRAVMRRVGF